MGIVKKTILLLILFQTQCYSNFIENKGQLFDSNGRKCEYIAAYTQNLPVNIYIHKNGKLSLVLSEKKSKRNEFNLHSNDKLEINHHRLDLKFINSLNPTIEMLNKLNYNHYYLDNEKYEYVENYESLIVRNIYNHIDLIIKTVNNKIKYDFIINPQGNPEDIKYYFEGGLETKTTLDGDIVVNTFFGELFDSKPICYQEDRTIKSEYRISRNIVSFQIENYDTSKPLIIDPIIWSNYNGGNGFDYSYSIDREAVISNNNSIEYFDFICGTSSNSSFPYTIGYSVSQSYTNAFISKYDEMNGTLKYSIFYGNNNSDVNFSDIQIIGLTQTRSYYAFSHQQNKKIIVCGTKLASPFNSTESGIIGSFESSTGILNYIQFKSGCILTKLSKVSFGNNSNDKVYVTGWSKNSHINLFQRTLDANQYNFGGGTSDAILLKLMPTNGTTLYSSYIGGNGSDRGFAIDVYKNQNNSQELIYVAGDTNSVNGLTSIGAYDITFNGGNSDGFLSIFSFNTSPINVISESFNNHITTTYFGGNTQDEIFDIEFDKEGANQTNPIFQINLVGRTAGNFPLLGSPFQINFGGQLDGFLATYNLTNNQFTYSTYLGGNGSDQIRTVKSYRYYGNYFIELLGGTNSTNFPVTSNAYKLNQSGFSDGFISVLHTNNLNGPANQLYYSTYFGSNLDFDEIIFDVAKTSLNGAGTNDTAGMLTFCGFSDINYPTLSNQQYSGNLDAVITRFSYMNAARSLNNEEKEEINTYSKIILFPNPTKKEINISPMFNNQKIKLFDIMGRLVFETKSLTNMELMTINFEHLESGIYKMIITKNENIIKSFNIIKE